MFAKYYLTVIMDILERISMQLFNVCDMKLGNVHVIEKFTSINS